MTKENNPSNDDSLTITLSKAQVVWILLPFMFVLGLISGYFLWEYEGKDTTQTTELGDNGGAGEETEQPDISPGDPLGVPSIGPEDAPITIIEFSDFECPYCQRHFLETFDKLFDAYEGQIRYEFRHLPLSFHENAFPAAEASLCAHEQGAFWPFHDYLYSGELGLGKEAYLEYAERLNLDIDEFTTCVEENRYEEQVKADIQAASILGVQATPTFFINDVKLEGAYPFEDFARIIDAELGITTDSGESEQAGQDAPTEEPVRYEIEILDTDPAYGPEDALITIIEYSDFECAFCQRHFQETYDQINDAYEGQFRYIFKHFPLTSIHPNALPAAVASLCADEQEAFWPFHDYLFSNELGLNKEAYLEYAERLSLDMDEFTTCVEENRYEAQILADMQTAVDLGVRSTPTFFINGFAVEGAYPFDVFAEIIDDELAAADGD